jgi:hypothetical protein
VKKGSKKGKAPQKPTPIGRVYWLWGEGTRSFKIGFTRGSVGRRAMQIEAFSAVPLRVLGVREGSMSDERDLHIELAPFRSHGEWFVLPETIVWDLAKRFGCVTSV